MSTPVLVRLRPGLHKLPLLDLDKALTKALDEIRKAHAAGLAVHVVSPDARTIKGRKRITEAFRHADLEPEIVSLLGWATTYPGAEPPAPREAIEAADDPLPVDKASEPPVLTEDSSE